jgi:hypothetical protein
VSRILQLGGWAFVALCAAVIWQGAPPRAVASTGTRPAPAVTPSASAPEEWFRRMKPYCNAVEIRFVREGTAPPAGWEGAGYLAACNALAGQIDVSRRIIDGLAPAERWQAAGIVFNVGHPVADAGDDRAAGPIMELVVDYWPTHYMALYHAGMAEYMLGQHALAKKNLEAFLELYHENDGWRSNAREVLGRLSSPRAAADLRRPREPS